MDWLDIKEFIKDTIKYIIFIAFVLFIAVYIVGFQQVVGSSMETNLSDKDVLIIDKFLYKYIGLKRFDGVTFNYDDSKYLIKRVIGLPGDYVEYKNNILYINNEIVDEPFLNDDIYTDNFSLKDLGYDIIPDDMYLVLGDNRGDSKDSRDKSVGLVSKKEIIGKIIIRVWPINKIKLI